MVDELTIVELQSNELEMLSETAVQFEALEIFSDSKAFDSQFIEVDCFLLCRTSDGLSLEGSTFAGLGLDLGRISGVKCPVILQ